MSEEEKKEQQQQQNICPHCKHNTHKTYMAKFAMENSYSVSAIVAARSYMVSTCNRAGRR